MIYSSCRFTLDIQKFHSQVSVPVARGDTAKTFYITLKDGGNPYYIENDCLARLSIKRPSGTFLQAYCAVENNTTIKYDFSENKNTAIEEGLHDCDVSLISESGETLTTSFFSMNVRATAVSSDDINISTEDQNMLNAIEAREASRQKAEEVRIQNESNRVSAEELRVKKMNEIIDTVNRKMAEMIDAVNKKLDELTEDDTTETNPPVEDEPITPVDPVPEPEPEPEPSTPTSYTVYYGSLMKDVELTAEVIQSLDSVTNTKSFSATFKHGYNRFALAFPSEFATNYTITDTTPYFGFELGDDDIDRMSDVTINSIRYIVLVYDVAVQDGDTPLSMNLT